MIDLNNVDIAEYMYHFVDDLNLWADVAEKDVSIAEYVCLYAHREFQEYLKGFSDSI